jgi:serine phosphatase RsbU (regulator of sigma subunit)
LQILNAVASQAAVALENGRLHEETLSQERINRELRLARDVQRSFLPQKEVKVDGLEFWAFYEAAGAVGGDYYDYFKLPNGKATILLGDVSGKGVPAALLMAKASSDAKVALITHADDLAAATGQLNNAICAANLEGRFMTLAMCLVDPKTWTLEIANAGHMSPIVRRGDGKLDEPADPDHSGLPIGIADEYPYETVVAQLQAGDCVVIYSDGISEAMNQAGQEFTADRIREIVRSGAADAAELGKKLLDDVQKHVNGWKQHDDMTLVVFRRT